MNPSLRFSVLQTRLGSASMFAGRLAVQTRFLGFFARIMAKGEVDHFKGHEDCFDGIIVESATETCRPKDFENCLQASMKQWTRDKKKTVWFRVDRTHAHWVPALTANGFLFHHAKRDQVVLYRWLPGENEICNVPAYAHTLLGMGAIVYREKSREILTVKEKYGKASHWKFPGGYVEPGENLIKAIEREVWEETGINAKFRTILAFRHAHGFAYDCSDIYVISWLVPETFDIRMGEQEIRECRWMNIKDFLAHPNVLSNNRLYATKLLESLDHQMGINLTTEINPLTEKPMSVYSLSKIISPDK